MIGVAVVMILLVLGVAGYVSIGKKTAQPAVTEFVEQTAPTPGQQSKTLRQLLAGGIAQKCTFSSEGTQGTVYVSGGKMRGDIQTTSDDGTTQSHMIVDGMTSYMWMDGQTTGFKTSWEASSPGPAGAGQTGIDPNKNVDYNCGPWVADASMMAMPAGVTFAEMSKVALPTGSSEPTVLKTGAPPECATCAAFTGAAKTQCLTSLGCN